MNFFLFEMQAYWSSIFILPTVVFKQIELLMTRFLWTSGKLAYCKAKVVWKDIAKSKKEGGLGLKRLTK